MKDINNYPLFTALVTPMNLNSEVQFDDLEKLARIQEKAGNGILILGSTGESLNLSLAEKKKIIEFIMNLNLKSPIMAGVGGINLSSTIEWVEYLENFEIDSYLMVTPLYAKPGDEGQKLWFESLLNKANKPCVLYNVPSRTGTSLSLKALGELIDHPQFWGVKEASGSIDQFQEYTRVCVNKKMFCGDDALMPEFARNGATGLISVASNTWPEETHIYTKLSLSNSLKKEDEKFWEIRSNLLFCAANPVPAKRLLFEKNIIKTSMMRMPLHHSDLKEAKELLKADSEVKSWANDYK